MVGGRLLLSRQTTQPTPSADGLASWADGEGGFFILSNAPSPPPFIREESQDQDDSAEKHVSKVYAAGDQACVWRAGEAFIKVHDVRVPDATREHVTLEFLHSKKPLDFDIPTVLYHGEWRSRYFLVLSRVPGKTLAEAWPAMDEETRQHCVCRVAESCAKMAEWRGHAICGVDGNQVLEYYLATKEQEKRGYLDPDDLAKTCARVGMDTSVASLGFYHCDLGPTNVLVDAASKRIGIIDWEMAGYVP